MKIFNKNKNKTLYDSTYIAPYIVDVSNKDLNYFFNIKSQLEHSGKFIYNYYIDNLEKELYIKGYAYLIKTLNGLEVANNYNLDNDILEINGIKYYDVNINALAKNIYIKVFDNSLKISKALCVNNVLNIMNEINNKILTNINNDKLKVFISGDNQTLNDLKSAVKEWQNGDNFIIPLENKTLKDNINFEKLAPFNNYLQYIDLFNYYNDLRLSFLGIESDKNDKKERLLEIEEEHKNATINNITQDEYTQRLIMCNKVKKYFKIDLEVKKNEN